MDKYFLQDKKLDMDTWVKSKNTCNEILIARNVNRYEIQNISDIIYDNISNIVNNMKYIHNIKIIVLKDIQNG